MESEGPDPEYIKRKVFSASESFSISKRQAILSKFHPYKPLSLKSDHEKDQASPSGCAPRIQATPNPTAFLSSRTSLPPKHQSLPRRTLSCVFAQFYILLYTAITLTFRIFKRIQRAIYHFLYFMADLFYSFHERSADRITRDLRGIGKLPKHLSVILPTFDHDLELGSVINSNSQASVTIPTRLEKRRIQMLLETHLKSLASIAAWSACAGVETLSVYERLGILKENLPAAHAAVSRSLYDLFPPPSTPSVSVRVPHLPEYSPQSDLDSSRHGSEKQLFGKSKCPIAHLRVVLLSEEDGRDTLVDLTKTLVDMVQRDKLSPGDISSELIDAEVKANILDEPDLLLCFGDRWTLEGYPPWQIRLTEIYHLKNNVNSKVRYFGWLWGLRRFAGAEMRWGR